MTNLPIPLPSGFVPTIQQEEQIIVGQIIASKKIQTDKIINIPKIMGIRRSTVKSVLKKNPGEAVEKGEIIAIKKSLFGTKNVILRSQVEGTVTRYERDSGNLVVKTGALVDTGMDNIISPVEGIAVLCNNDEIVISTDKDVLVGKKSVGGTGQGEVIRIEREDPYYLSANTIGKIVIGKNFTREMLLKGIGIGVAGIVGTRINDEDIEHILEKNFQTPILEISEPNWMHLLEWSGKKIFINAETKSIIFLHT